MRIKLMKKTLEQQSVRFNC